MFRLWPIGFGLATFAVALGAIAVYAQLGDTQTASGVINAAGAATPIPAPDLVVENISDAQSPLIDCTTPAGVKVVVRNIGTAPAGTSTTSVSVDFQSQGLSTPAIAPGEAVTLFSTVVGIPLGDTYVATADSNDAIAESDETNNSRVENLALGTLPTCTPTPTPTPTNTPTPTPTPTPTHTPTPVPPTPIGGIGIFPAVPGIGADGGGAAVPAWLAGGAVAGALALGGAAWYARSRRPG